MLPLRFLPFLAPSIATATLLPICPPSLSQPDPIVAQYPNDVTGTVNGTLILLPIPWRDARAVIPQQYAILTRACAAVLPGFCEGAGEEVYPVCRCTAAVLPSGVAAGDTASCKAIPSSNAASINVLTTVQLLINSFRDHDAQEGAFHVPDFSRFSLYYPFVDLLGDGYSSFAFQAGALIETTAPIAISGFDMYGPPLATPGSFVPACDPYSADAQGALIRAAYDLTGQQVAKQRFERAWAPKRFTLEAARNLTNQPVFGSGSMCDNFITLFNSSVTTGKYAPVPVRGTVQVAPPLYPQNTTFEWVEGWKVDLAFVERGNKDCETLKGYHGTGSGD